VRAHQPLAHRLGPRPRQPDIGVERTHRIGMAHQRHARAWIVAQERGQRAQARIGILGQRRRPRGERKPVEHRMPLGDKPLREVVGRRVGRRLSGVGAPVSASAGTMGTAGSGTAPGAAGSTAVTCT
jgi:hypothetical protein